MWWAHWIGSRFQVYSTILFIILIVLYDEYNLLIIITEIYIFLELIHLITESLYPLASISPFFYPEPLVAIIPLSAALSLTFLDSTYKWYYNIVILNLAYFTKIPWRRKWQPTPVLLPGESHGRRSLVGYSPRGRKESDTTERLHFTSLQCPLSWAMLSQMADFPLFSAWLVFHFMYIPHVLYPFIHWWKFRLLPFLGYCEWCCNGHGVQVSFQHHDFSTFGWIPRSGIARPHSSPIFNILRNFHTVSHNGCTNFLSMACKGSLVYISLLTKHLFLKKIIVTLTEVKWYLNVTLICIFLIISDVEYLYMYLLAICMSSLEKWLLSSALF